MPYDNPQNAGKVLKVGDILMTRWGESAVARIRVCPLPTTDPGGEASGFDVEEVELADVPVVLDLADGHWLSGREANARRVGG